MSCYVVKERPGGERRRRSSVSCSVVKERSGGERRRRSSV